MVRINISPEMRCTCDAETKPSEIDHAFSSSRYCLLAPARLDAFDLSSKKWIKVETTSLQPILYALVGATLNDFEVNAVLKSSVDLEFKAYVNQRQRYNEQLFDIVRGTTASGLFYHFHGENMQSQVFFGLLHAFFLLGCVLMKAANTISSMNKRPQRRGKDIIS